MQRYRLQQQEGGLVAPETTRLPQAEALLAHDGPSAEGSLAQPEAGPPGELPLGLFLQAARLLRRFLRPDEEEQDERPSLRGRWRVATPLQARRAAALLRAAPELFAGLRFGAADLLGELDRIGELESARAAAALLLDRIDTALAARKRRLADRTAAVERARGAKLADPSLPAEAREALQVFGEALDELPERQREAVRQSRCCARAKPSSAGSPRPGGADARRRSSPAPAPPPPAPRP